MQTVKHLSEIDTITNVILRDYICQKAANMMAAYGLHTLDDIGCFTVLDKTEIQLFDVSEMEFVEVLQIGNEMFLHGVKILGDSYAEDIYLPVEVIPC